MFYSYYLVNTIIWLCSRYSTELWLLLYYDCDIFLRFLYLLLWYKILNPLKGNRHDLNIFVNISYYMYCIRYDYASVHILHLSIEHTAISLLPGTCTYRIMKYFGTSYKILLDDQNLYLNVIRTYSCLLLQCFPVQCYITYPGTYFLHCSMVNFLIQENSNTFRKIRIPS